MSKLQVRTSWEIVNSNLSDLIAMPDDRAASVLNERMAVLDQIHKIHERSYSERGIIAREFERRELWRHLTDPDTGTTFASFSAWMSCSDFLGCRRVNFEAKKSMQMLSDVPVEKLIDVPKASIHVLTQLSTQVRNDPGILEAARTLSTDQLLEKLEKEIPSQHVESRKMFRFSLERSAAKEVDQAIEWALSHDIAGSASEALIYMAHEALKNWELDEEIRQMKQEEEVS